MNPNFDENLVRRYLLGELDEDRQISVEDRVFADSETRALLEAAETDLIDEYARGELSQIEHAKFEQRFFNSAERRRRIEFAQNLVQIARPKTAELKTIAAAQPNFWQKLFSFQFAPQFAFAAIALIVAAFGAWFLLTRQSSNPEIARETTDQPANQTARETISPAANVAPSIEVNQNTALNQNVAPQANQTNVRNTNTGAGRNVNNNAPDTNKNAPDANRLKNPAANSQTAPLNNKNVAVPAAPTFAALVFPIGATRAANAAKLELALPPNVAAARLVFNLEKGDEFPRYQIGIVNQAGAAVVQSKSQRRNRTVVLSVPAAKLAAGAYAATLRGISADGQIETIGYYDFTVRRP